MGPMRPLAVSSLCSTHHCSNFAGLLILIPMFVFLVFPDSSDEVSDSLGSEACQLDLINLGRIVLGMLAVTLPLVSIVFRIVYVGLRTVGVRNGYCCRSEKWSLWSALVDWQHLFGFRIVCMSFRIVDVANLVFQP